MPDSWHSYPSIYNLGHHAVDGLFTEPVIIQEKVDGSQFSFGVFDGELRVRSKGAQLVTDAPERMFKAAVESVQAVALGLVDGYTYRAEFLSKPKHNSLKYDRIPRNHLVLFDVDAAEESPLDYEDVAIEADRLGFDVTPSFFEGIWTGGADELLALLKNDSLLGGTTVEGVVIKSFTMFGQDKKRLMGKFVSERFKEIHEREWKKSNPQGADVVQSLILSLRTEARWEKSVQHLREAGQIEDDVRDIGKLMSAVKEDTEKECEDEIKNALYKWAKDKILRGASAGLPEWYKRRLLAGQFEDTP